MLISTTSNAPIVPSSVVVKDVASGAVIPLTGMIRYGDAVDDEEALELEVEEDLELDDEELVGDCVDFG